MKRIEERVPEGYMAQRGFNVLYVLQNNFLSLEKRAVKEGILRKCYRFHDIKCHLEQKAWEM